MLNQIQSVISTGFRVKLCQSVLLPEGRFIWMWSKKLSIYVFHQFKRLVASNTIIVKYIWKYQQPWMIFISYRLMNSTYWMKRFLVFVKVNDYDDKCWCREEFDNNRRIFMSCIDGAAQNWHFSKKVMRRNMKQRNVCMKISDIGNDWSISFEVALLVYLHLRPLSWHRTNNPLMIRTAMYRATLVQHDRTHLVIVEWHMTFFRWGEIYPSLSRINDVDTCLL